MTALCAVPELRRHLRSELRLRKRDSRFAGPRRSLLTHSNATAPGTSCICFTLADSDATPSTYTCCRASLASTSQSSSRGLKIVFSADTAGVASSCRLSQLGRTTNTRIGHYCSQLLSRAWQAGICSSDESPKKVLQTFPLVAISSFLAPSSKQLAG